MYELGIQPLPAFPCSPQFIQGTLSSSINATMALNKSFISYFDIVYQEGTSSIKDVKLVCYYAGGSWQHYQVYGPVVISNGTGVKNYQPSMVQMPNNYIRVCWIRDQMGDPNQPFYINTVYWDEYSNSYTAWMTGINTQSVSLNVRDDNARTFYSWSDNGWGGSNYPNYASNGSTYISLSTMGRYVQLSNGPYSGGSSNMVTSAFNTSSSPYYFQNAGDIGNSLQKSATQQMTYGRGGTIVKGDMAFNYIFGNLIVDKNSIDFVDAPDSLKYNNLDTVNSVLVTQPFSITDKSRIVFMEECGFIDSALAAKTLRAGEYIAYKVDLINQVTGNVLCTLKSKTFNSSKASACKRVPYLLDVKKFGSGTVRAKITITTNIDSAKFALMKSYSNVDQTDGSSIQSLDLQTADIVTTSALGQNFPNPFNPATTISYQIPKDGRVTIKIFDVTGREVTTLVDEFKPSGQYSVRFDASHLSSGIYFYSIKSGDYSAVKKMSLIK